MRESDYEEYLGFQPQFFFQDITVTAVKYLNIEYYDIRLKI